MKAITALWVVIWLGMVVVTAGVGAEPPAASPPGGPVEVASTNGPSPKIQFATPIYDFGKVKSGTPVKFDYVFTNIGLALLEVTDVRPGCGCTTAGAWSRQVEPGKTGTIPIQYNASGAGQITKSVTVTCNDKSQPTVSLQIKGTVWNPVDVIPSYAIFNVNTESLSNATSVVRIVNNEEQPITLAPPESNNGAFAPELKEKQAGKEYELIIKLVPPLETGNVQGVVSLKSSSTNVPVVNVTAVANLQPALVAMPSQVNLPAAPISNSLPATVFIRNNGLAPRVLSEPQVNAKGVDVQMKEVEPGRYFSFTLTFPAGFEIATGEKVELSVKTDHPQFPTFKVPVFQVPVFQHPPPPPGQHASSEDAEPPEIEVPLAGDGHVDGVRVAVGGPPAQTEPRGEPAALGDERLVGPQEARNEVVR